uniref:RNA-directed DNA polymerase n=1 Tax=Strongyloides venezuelensis TaxID=75913 RepID=A0A0K0FRP0_STRVS
MDITPGEVVCQEQFFFSRDPKKYPSYPIPSNLESTAIEIAEQWVKAGVLKRGTATLNHPTMLVKKPNGSYRLVSDLRKINDITKKLDIRQKPVMETIMEMKPFYYCSRIDLKSAYAQFMLHENNRNDFGLTVGSRNYVYLTLPMGAKNSSNLLHIEMQKIFTDLIKSKELILYHDDALLLTNDEDPEIHMNLLRRFFALMRRFKLKASFSKSSFFLKQVEFLSFTIDKDGWKPSQSSITKILNIKVPKTKKQLLRFLLATNYFRSCIKNYSQRSAKLFALTTGKKNSNINLIGENLEIYKNIVDELINPQKLNFGDCNKKYYLHTDSSETGLGGCLTQMVDIDGHEVEKPLAFYSMKLPYSARKRHSTYLELKAIVACLKHWSYILINCKKGIEIICDHKPLTTIKNTATEGRFIELLNYLAEYDAEITYRKGEDNVVPDWLSRLHEYEEELKKDDEVDIQMVNYTQLENQLHTYAATKKRKRGRPRKVKEPEVIDKNSEFKLLQILTNQNTILNTEELKEHQEKDETIQKALSTGFHLDYPVRKIDGVVKIKINDNKNVKSGGSNHFQKEENEGFVCFIPKSLSNKIISLLHENGHFSYIKTRAMLRQLAYCEKMSMNIRKVLDNCIICARRNVAPTNQPSAKVTSYAEYPMDSLSLDLLCPAKSDDGFKYVMNVQDNCTRYLWCIPLKSKSSKEILNELLRWVMLPFGMTKSLRTDGDGMFSSDNFITECKELGINVIKSTPRDSQSNSLIERTFRTTSAIIYKISCNNNISWSKTLPLVANYMNTSKTGNMTYSPYEKLFLQQPHNQITRYLQSNIKYVDRNQDLHELMNVAAYIRHLDNEYSEEIKSRINEKAKIKNVIYKPGDKFMYKKNLEGKFNNLYQGPFIVLKDLDTKVTFKAKNGKILTASKAKIKRFYGDV